MKIASSGTLEGIKKITKEYLYSDNIELKETSPNNWDVYNAKGKTNSFTVELKKKRYILIGK